MIKTTFVAVPIDEQTHEVVRRVAYEERCSKAEVFRVALTRYLRTRDRVKQERAKR